MTDILEEIRKRQDEMISTEDICSKSISDRGFKQCMAKARTREMPLRTRPGKVTLVEVNDIYRRQ